MGDRILQRDEQRCKEVNPYLHSYWGDMHVRSGGVCVDERVAIPHSIQDAVLESLLLPHPGSWGMITLGQYAFCWPYMHWEILIESAQCEPWTEICKNLEPVIPASKWQLLINCSEHNKKIELEFGGPVTSEKDRDIHFFACMDRFSNYHTVEVFYTPKGPNVFVINTWFLEILD